MKLKIISLCIFLIAMFLSCKKEDAIIVGNTNTLLLSQVKTNNQPTTEYLYNVANLISEEKGKFDFTLNHYNDKNQLVSSDLYANFSILSSDLKVYQAAIARNEWVTPVVANKGGTVTYQYNDKDQLVKSTYTPSSGSPQSSDFSYNANNRIGRQILYWENEQTGYIDYSYDDKGNLIKEILYNISSAGTAELSTTTGYEFDNQKNPYKSASRLMTPGITTNANNIIKETYTIHEGAGNGPDKVQITESAYKYNSQGFPISKNGNIEYIYG